MRRAEPRSVLESFLLTSKSWSEGYRFFNRLFGRPLGWLFAFQDGKTRLIRLDQKGHCSFFAKSSSNQEGCFQFLAKYLEQLRDNRDKQVELPFFYKCAYGRQGIVFGVRHGEQLKGFLALCTVSKKQSEIKDYISALDYFLQSETMLAYKNYELQNFYETVHPRALALTTMHSVNRIISSSLRLDQLLPQIGRLFAQVLKANDCTLYFLDEQSKYLVPKFSLKNRKVIQKSKIRFGRGVEGHVAETAEFFFSKKCISIPMIGEDVIGVVTLENKLDGLPFSAMDLEILKTLMEQAVVAIKNAKLYDETEQLTLSSIQAINELLELSYGTSNVRLPLLSELVFEMGKDLSLSGSELTNLHRATFVIDTGHLTTPEHILSKKTNLTRMEFEQIKRHPKVGAAVLEKMGVLQPVIPIILHHHERFDGTGYPNGLKGESIPIGARIVSVADAFTAMLFERPYRISKSVEEAIEEIKKNSSTQFDPRVVNSFLKVIQLSSIQKKIQRLAMGEKHMEAGE